MAMKIIKGTLFSLLFAPCISDASSNAGFAYAGFSLKSKIEQVKRRYPNSVITDNYIYVSPRDTHDHIYGIELATTAKAPRVRIGFEKPAAGRSKQRTLSYPTCSRIHGGLQEQYGAPTKVRKFYEEKTKRFDQEWTRAGEVMTLACFRGDHGKYLAESITITTER